MKIATEGLIDICKAWYAIPGNECGGLLHAVLDDGNLEDIHIEWSRDKAKEEGDLTCWAIAQLLLMVGIRQREELYSKL